jgi:hypothetical protein
MRSSRSSLSRSSPTRTAAISAPGRGVHAVVAQLADQDGGGDERAGQWQTISSALQPL